MTTRTWHERNVSVGLHRPRVGGSRGRCRRHPVRDFLTGRLSPTSDNLIRAVPVPAHERDAFGADGHPVRRRQRSDVQGVVGTSHSARNCAEHRRLLRWTFDVANHWASSDWKRATHRYSPAVPLRLRNGDPNGNGARRLATVDEGPRVPLAIEAFEGDALSADGSAEAPRDRPGASEREAVQPDRSLIAIDLAINVGARHLNLVTCTQSDRP